ncbi:RNA polymerase sigma-I factor [Dethiothermospora halolimnae]|uniref:RNA polymerase sigma-I factor n=1 Tax=Dethiothermospora halolimnae TaxID=3114390 RepID=UPI003CCB7D56
MGRILKLFKKKNSTLEKRLRKIKSGDIEEREKLISDYTPFIIKTITKVTNRYIETENDDEYSIGLGAFNESIDKYDFKKGNFISFSSMIIRNRIIDYKRKNTGNNKAILIDRDDYNREINSQLKTSSFTENYHVKEQINRFEKELKKFNIKLDDLIESSPKHIDTRLNSIKIARFILDNGEIKSKLYKSKQMPVKKITESIGFSAKVLKGNRKFIIATLIILDSDLDVLKNYVLEVERRDDYGI